MESAEGPENEVFNPAPEQEKSSILGAGLNFMNAIVGAGIVAIPYALKECGPIVGIMSLVFIGLLTGGLLVDTWVCC